MKAKLALGLLLLLVASTAVALKPPTAASPDLEGTYRLVRRDLPDGTTMTPPALQGLITYADGYRNFNIFWSDSAGKRTSIGAIATYELTADQYTETNVYYAVNDEVDGSGITYDLTPTSASSPVTREGDRIEMDLPLHDEPHVVYDTGGLTASREGVFVDHWERID